MTPSASGMRWVRFGKDGDLRGWGLVAADGKTLGMVYRSASSAFFEDGWRTDKRHGCGCARVFRTVWGAASHVLKSLGDAEHPMYGFSLLRALGER